MEIHTQKTRALADAVARSVATDPQFGFSLPQLDEDNILVCLREGGIITSFVYCYIDNQTILTFVAGFTHRKYRRQGLSEKIRRWIIEYFPQIHEFRSVPLPGSKSYELLKKLGFEDKGMYMSFIR